MQPAVPSNRHVLLAIQQNLDLIAHIAQPPNNLAVSIYKPQNGIRHAGLRAKLLDHALDGSKVVPRHAREQVMDGLELQAAVDKVQPGRTIDVQRGA